MGSKSWSRSLLRIAALMMVTSVCSAGVFSSTSFAYGSGEADCLQPLSAGLKTFPGMKPVYVVTIGYECSGTSGPGLYRVALMMQNGSPQYQSRPFGLASFVDEIRYDISDLDPGTYQPVIYFAVTSDGSSASVRLPDLTIKPSADTGATSGDTSRVTCVKVAGQKRSCTSGTTWRYAACWPQASGARLQRQISGRWRTVATRISAKNSCSPTGPWSVVVSQREVATGTIAYRIYVPATGDNPAQIRPITVTVR